MLDSGTRSRGLFRCVRCHSSLYLPAYPWLMTDVVDAGSIAAHMTGLRRVGVPYTDSEIAKAADDVKGRTEVEALIAYLQVLGLTRR